MDGPADIVGDGKADTNIGGPECGRDKPIYGHGSGKGNECGIAHPESKITGTECGTAKVETQIGTDRHDNNTKDRDRFCSNEKLNY